jgi:hypothetical protein
VRQAVISGQADQADGSRQADAPSALPPGDDLADDDDRTAVAA